MALVLATAFIVVAILVAMFVILVHLDDLQERFMTQIDDLRAAIAQVGTDLGEAIARVDAKVSSLGEPDPDLTADIDALKAVSASLDNLVAESPAEPPAEGPVEPPVEPPVG
jgi:hypothetical protein